MLLRSDRQRELTKLTSCSPSEIADLSPAGRLRILRRLRCALRRERQRGLSSHWAYDLARHTQLLAAYRSEALAYAQAVANKPAPANGGGT